MSVYSKTDPMIWTGRKSESKLYFHEKAVCVDIAQIKDKSKDKSKVKTFGEDYAILGYACDEGVKRNKGRTGAIKGPNAIKAQLGKLPAHLPETTSLLDVGNISCLDDDMESTQEMLSQKISFLLDNNVFPLVLGGGHDVAYAHYNGIKNHLPKDRTIGIINFDAHFDLRSNDTGNTSGTPFYQIADDLNAAPADFNYLCLGIRRDANDSVLFKTADDLNVQYVEQNRFNFHYLEHVRSRLMKFIQNVDHIYTTIDMDGFSSAYAPGVSAASPMGFSPDIVLECLKVILDSGKLISLDIAELNPKYDNDDQTAKLAASLVHFVLHNREAHTLS